MLYKKFIEFQGSYVADVNFVAKALSKDETREQMMYLYFQKNRLIATDGRRMHYLVFTEGQKDFWGLKEDTFYKYLKGTKKIAWIVEFENDKLNFPDIDRILKNNGKPKKTDYSVQSGRSSESDMFFQIKNLLSLLPEDRMINLEYLKMLPKSKTFKAKLYENGQLHLDSEPLHAIFMVLSQ